MKKLAISRPQPLLFELDGGREFIVSPVTRARYRAALELEPEAGAEESEEQLSTRRAAELAALIGPTVGLPDGTEVPSATLLDGLTPDEEIQILWALMGQAAGHDPAAAAALYPALKKKHWLPRLNASPDSTATPSSSAPTSTSPQP